MNYIKQLNAFWEWLTFHDLSDTEVRTYLALLHCENRLFWTDEASIPNKAVMHYAGISGKTQLIRIRNRLESAGLIVYTNGEKGKSGTYKFIKLYENGTDNITANDTANVTEPVTKSVTESVTNSATQIKHNTKNIKHNTENNTVSANRQQFDEFWTEYPRKVGKKDALKAWNKIKPDIHTATAIMQGLSSAKQCEQWRRDNGQYIPHASTWLNGRRWEDDYTVTGIKPVTASVTDIDTTCMTPTEGIDDIEAAFRAAYSG